jgi:alpha/beta superfamily hydrolase
MKKLLTILLVLSFLTSCLRLDSNLFNPEEKISSYQLDGYKGKRECPDLPEKFNIPDSLVHVFQVESDNNGDKARIWCIYLGDRARISKDTVLLYCHGNKNHMDNYWNRAKLLANVNGKNRYGVLMMDYRGFGLSDGTPTEGNMYADVEACIQWLKNNGIKDGNLMVYGYSLGSAPAIKLAGKINVKPFSKLILEAPYGNAQTMVEDAAKLSLPSSYFTNVKVNNADEIKKVSVQFCWFHGANDEFLSLPVHGQKVFDNYKGPYKEAHIVQRAIHNNLPSVMGYEEYLSVLGKFIRR